jgi:hypothetical protein
VDREQSRHVASRRVDVQGDVLVGRFRLEVKQLGDHQVGDMIVDRRPEEHDPVGEQSRVDVVGAFATVGRLDDGWNEHTGLLH